MSFYQLPELDWQVPGVCIARNRLMGWQEIQTTDDFGNMVEIRAYADMMVFCFGEESH